MDWQGLAPLLFVVASVTADTDGQHHLFHLPWACSVLHDSGSLVGACAILNAANVLVSVDNFNETVPKLSIQYFKALDELRVWAGSNYMNPSKAKNKPQFAQFREVDNLYVGVHNSREDFSGSWQYIEKPMKDLDHQVPQDAFGVHFNIAILKLKHGFQWSSYVRPISLKMHHNLELETTEFFREISDLKRNPNHICVTYSWSEPANKIRYHQVMYLPKEYCVDAFCGWKFSICNSFPNKTHLVCFKSTKFTDVCPTARGAALYCPTFKKSVFAILTSAPSCGLRHMPGVYTTLPSAIRLYESVYKTDFTREEEIYLDDPFSLDQRESDYE